MLMGLPAETPDFVHPMLVSPQVSPLCFCPLLSSPGSQVLAGLKLTLLQNQQEKKKQQWFLTTNILKGVF